MRAGSEAVLRFGEAGRPPRAAALRPVPAALEEGQPGLCRILCRVLADFASRGQNPLVVRLPVGVLKRLRLAQLRVARPLRFCCGGGAGMPAIPPGARRTGAKPCRRRKWAPHRNPQKTAGRQDAGPPLFVFAARRKPSPTSWSRAAPAGGHRARPCDGKESRPRRVGRVHRLSERDEGLGLVTRETAQKPDDEGEIRGVQRKCAVFCASLMLDRRFTRGILWNFDSRRLQFYGCRGIPAPCSLGRPSGRRPHLRAAVLCAVDGVDRQPAGLGIRRSRKSGSRGGCPCQSRRRWKPSGGMMPKDGFHRASWRPGTDPRSGLVDRKQASGEMARATPTHATGPRPAKAPGTAQAPGGRRT